MTAKKKAINKSFVSKIEYDIDSDGKVFYLINVPEELLSDLNWVEETQLQLEVKLGPKNNVLVVSKKPT